MKAAIFKGPKKIEYTDVEKPMIKPHEVLMHVRAVGICGTDLHIYNGGLKIPKDIIIGHEFAGEVAEVGENIQDLKKGDKITAEHVLSCKVCLYCGQGDPNLCPSSEIFGIDRPGALAEYMAIPREMVFKFPDSLSFEQAALIEPLSIAVYVVRESPFLLDRSVAVLGQGTIGLLIGKIARLSGARVIGIDIRDSRLKFAREGGFIDYALNPNTQDIVKEISKITHDAVDVTFEAVGIQETADMSIDITRRDGTIFLVGLFEGPEKIHIEKIVKKELNLSGSFTCAFSFPTAINLASSGQIDMESLITHRYPLKDISKAFYEASMYTEDRIKTIITI